MPTDATPTRFVFPRWANYLLPLAVVGAIASGMYLPVLVGLGASADTLNVGYAPDQPVPYSHALHVGELGMDCRYCHNTVEDAAFAAIPPTQTCINCHNPATTGAGVRKNSPKLKELHESYNTGKSVKWKKVHDLPDYAYFNHSAHINKGVSCVSCHGRVDKMEVVYQAKSLSMAWCLECHREPEKFLRPVDQVTNLSWEPEVQPGETKADAQLRIGLDLKQKYNIHDQAYMTSCSTCHR